MISKRIIFPVLLCLMGNTSCTDNKPSAAYKALVNPKEGHKYVQVNYEVNNQEPTARIPGYTLITNDIERDSSNARAIMRAKVILPLAMQRHDGSLFESVLSKDFVSQGEDEFFDRQEYIQNRVNGKWMITDVEYENVVLQFFGDFGVLTYRNTVVETNESGKENTFHWTWADIWIKEGGEWKIKVLRAIN